MTFGITDVWAHSAPNFSTNFFKFNVAASRIAYTKCKKNYKTILIIIIFYLTQSNHKNIYFNRNRENYKSRIA